MSESTIVPVGTADETRADTYRELFERSTDAILIIEGDRFVDCNQACVEMLRYGTREEVLQTHPSELSPEYQPDGRLSYEKANDMIQTAFSNGSHRFEWDHKRADGEVFPVEVLLTVVNEGERPTLHTVWRDITERKRLENELRQAQKMEAIGKLAGGIAHDFNNLLVAILGNSELMEMDLEPGDPMMEHVLEIREAGDRAAALVGQLLAYSRKQILRASVLELNGVVGDLQSMLSRLIGEDISMDWEPNTKPLAVKVDKGQLEQVIMNLVTNARDAMPKGGVLTLMTTCTAIEKRDSAYGPKLEPGRYAVLRVTDTGDGVEPGVVDQIFDPFFTTKPKGTGLGLSTVIGIVRQSGGDVVVSSAPGRGATFSVYLPLTDEDVPAPDLRLLGDEVTGNPVETILLVEDEPSVARLTTRVLEHEGYTVRSASNGREALSMIDAGDVDFDLLLTDVVMPGMGGPELARNLERTHPELRVLYASGYTNEALTSRGILEEGVELIQKPFTTDQLKERVRKVLDT